MRAYRRPSAVAGAPARASSVAARCARAAHAHQGVGAGVHHVAQAARRRGGDAQQLRFEVGVQAQKAAQRIQRLAQRNGQQLVTPGQILAQFRRGGRAGEPRALRPQLLRPGGQFGGVADAGGDDARGCLPRRNAHRQAHGVPKAEIGQPGKVIAVGFQAEPESLLAQRLDVLEIGEVARRRDPDQVDAVELADEFARQVRGTDFHQQRLACRHFVCHQGIQAGEQHVFIQVLQMGGGRCAGQAPAQHQFARRDAAAAIEQGLEGEKAVAQFFLAHRRGSLAVHFDDARPVVQRRGVYAAAGGVRWRTGAIRSRFGRGFLRQDIQRVAHGRRVVEPALERLAIISHTALSCHQSRGREPWLKL